LENLMFVLTPATIALCILAPIVAYFLAQKLFKLDTAVEQRRLAAAQVAGKLQSYGLKRIPALLTCYSVGDYSGFVHGLGDMVRLFLDGDEAIVKELDATFDRVLAAKLKTEEGRAILSARLTEVKPA
jgi:hypothetical protein